jgi:hypothetical protein
MSVFYPQDSSSQRGNVKLTPLVCGPSSSSQLNTSIGPCYALEGDEFLKSGGEASMCVDRQ